MPNAPVKLSITDKLIFHCKVTHPSLKHIAKKNRRPIFMRGGRPSLGKSEDLNVQEKIIESAFMMEMKRQGVRPCAEPAKRRKPSDAPRYHVIYKFHFGKGNTFGFHKSDLTNLMEIVSDSLTKSKIIEDDRHIHSVDGSRKLLSEETMLEVWVFKHTED